MAPSWVVEAVDVLEDSGSCLLPCGPCLSPEHFGLQALEEGLHSCVVEAISLAGHGGHHPVFRQLFLEIVRAILAAMIRVENTARQRIAQSHSHIERFDCKVLLHPVARGPANDASAEQIDDNSQVKPPLVCPDVANIACPFPVGSVGHEIAV